MNWFQKMRHLQKARPNLAVSSPLVFWLCIGLVMFNIGIGFMIRTNTPVQNATIVIYQLISPLFMSFAFTLTAFLILAGLILNAWSLIKAGLGLGIFFKAMYAYSFVVLGAKIGFQKVASIMILWLFIMFVQILMVIFFLPPGNEDIELSGRLNDGIKR